MKTLSSTFLFLVFALFFTACDDGTSSKENAGDSTHDGALIGTWAAPLPEITEDSSMDGTFRAILRSDGTMTFSMTITAVITEEGDTISGALLDSLLEEEGMPNPYSSDGTWHTEDNKLYTIDPSDPTAESIMNYSIKGTTLTLTDPEDSSETIVLTKE